MFKNKVNNQYNQNRIHGIDFGINQIPSVSNNNTAVVKAIIDKGSGSFSSIGVGQHETLNGSGDCQELLDMASKAAIHNAKELAGIIAGTSVDKMPNRAMAQQTVHSRGHSTIPGSISPRQRGTLATKAHKAHTTLDRLAREKFGISENELSSEQANVLFKKLDNR